MPFKHVFWKHSAICNYLCVCVLFCYRYSSKSVTLSCPNPFFGAHSLTSSSASIKDKMA